MQKYEEEHVERYGVDSLEGAQRCSKLVFPDGKCSDGKGGL